MSPKYLCDCYRTSLWLVPSSVWWKDRKCSMGVSSLLAFNLILWNRVCTFSGLSNFRNEAIIHDERACYRFQSENLDSNFSSAYHEGEIEKVSYLSTLISSLWKGWNYNFLLRTTGLKFLTMYQPVKTSHITVGPIQNLIVTKEILAGTDPRSALQSCIRKEDLDENKHRL